MSVKEFLPPQKGRIYTLDQSQHLVAEIMEVDDRTGRAHGRVFLKESGTTAHYASWWSGTGAAIGGIARELTGVLPGWEEDFPWSAIHQRYKWASFDRSGVWEVHSEEPILDYDYGSYYSADESVAGTDSLSDPAWRLPVPPGGGPVCIKRPE